MSRIDNLIAELCPNGVPFFKIGLLAQVGTGSSDRKNAVVGGRFPFYVRSKDIMRIDAFEFDEDAILIPGEGGIGDIFHYVSGKYALHQRAYRIHFVDERINVKYAYYYFRANFKKFILQKAVSATVTSIRKPMITEFSIPVPPPAVQQEIVRILDQFTQLEAELEAELEARKQQYEYYRSLLLSFDNPHAWTTLGKAFKLKAGKSIRASEIQSAPTDSHKIPCFGGNGIRGFVGTQTHEGDFPLIGRQGALCGNLNWANGNFYATEHAIVAAPNIGVNARWAYHMLGFMNLNQFATKSAQPGLSVARLSKVPISLPNLERQEEVARILDSFDSMINGLNYGLPAEISARRKQYEYYRDKLLTFKELPA